MRAYSARSVPDACDVQTIHAQAVCLSNDTVDDVGGGGTAHQV